MYISPPLKKEMLEGISFETFSVRGVTVSLFVSINSVSVSREELFHFFLVRNLSRKKYFPIYSYGWDMHHPKMFDDLPCLCYALNVINNIKGSQSLFGHLENLVTIWAYSPNDLNLHFSLPPFPLKSTGASEGFY